MIPMFGSTCSNMLYVAPFAGVMQAEKIRKGSGRRFSPQTGNKLDRVPYPGAFNTGRSKGSVRERVFMWNTLDMVGDVGGHEWGCDF